MRRICYIVHFLAIIAYSYAIKAEYACIGSPDEGIIILIYNEFGESFQFAAVKSVASNPLCVATGAGTKEDQFKLDLKMDNSGTNELEMCGVEGNGTTDSPANLTVIVQHNSLIVQVTDKLFDFSCDFSKPRVQEVKLEGTKAREPCADDQFYCSVTNTCFERLFRCLGIGGSNGRCLNNGQEFGCNQNVSTGSFNVEKSTGSEVLIEHRGFGYRLNNLVAVIEDIVEPQYREKYDLARDNYTTLGQSNCTYPENKRYKDWFNEKKPNADCDFFAGLETMLLNSCQEYQKAADADVYFKQVACQTTGCMGLSANITLLAILMMLLAIF